MFSEQTALTLESKKEGKREFPNIFLVFHPQNNLRVLFSQCLNIGENSREEQEQVRTGNTVRLFKRHNRGVGQKQDGI